MYTMNLFPKKAIKSIGFGMAGEMNIIVLIFVIKRETKLHNTIILKKVHRRRNSKYHVGLGGLLDDIVLL